MRGYPKHVATKQDYINLLNMQEHRMRALADLNKLKQYDENTAIVKQVIILGDVAKDQPDTTKNIPTPLPLWKQKGFKSLIEVDELIASQKEEI